VLFARVAPQVERRAALASSTAASEQLKNSLKYRLVRFEVHQSTRPRSESMASK
jgi:hypothetical protein